MGNLNQLEGQIHAKQGQNRDFSTGLIDFLWKKANFRGYRKSYTEEPKEPQVAHGWTKSSENVTFWSSNWVGLDEYLQSVEFTPISF
jgi:hypothetical protein